LEPGELITAVTLPKPRGGVHIYRKVRERASYAFANVSVALIAKVERGRVTVDRLAFGGLAHKPWRVEEAERVFADGDDAKADPIADVVLIGATPTEQNAYKLPLVRRTLAAAIENARQGGNR
jgi:xanthine dehydrogenase YagS FAD-binding subunit